MQSVLEDIAANAKDPVSRCYATEALARTHPGEAVDRLLDFIRHDNHIDLGVGPLREFASEKDAERIIDVLLGREKAPGHAAIPLSVTRLLLERLGARGRVAVEGAMARLEPSARMWAMWKLKSLDLRTAVDDLHGAGVIAIARGPLLERMRKGRETVDEIEPIDLSDPGSFTGALAHADVLTMFDVESDELPCRHDRLILEFATGSAGRFKPECPVQTWHRKRENDFDAPYTVRFLYKGRLYRFGAENRGDWYDVEAVLRALNFALETAGQKERFIAEESDGQVASFVFAVPAAFLPIAEKYGSPLSQDPDEAMRKGKEYEQKAFDQSRE
jgi:hypothetical protein